MLISKKQGEKLSNKNMSTIYGSATCGGSCGDCDCRSSNGDNFSSSHDPEMKSWEGLFTSFNPI